MHAIGEPYTRAEVLEYLEFCRKEGQAKLAALDFAGSSGFDWLPFSKLELQMYLIRHLQHHTGELGARLSSRGIDIGWVGGGSLGSGETAPKKPSFCEKLGFCTHPTQRPYYFCPYTFM